MYVLSENKIIQVSTSRMFQIKNSNNVCFQVPVNIFSVIQDRATSSLVLSSTFFLLRFNVQVNNFSVMSGRSHCFLGFNQYSRELMCLAQGHNMVTLVGI